MWTTHDDIQIILRGEWQITHKDNCKNVWDFGLDDYQVGDKQLKLLYNLSLV